MDWRVISIGTLSRNRLWDEVAVKRVPHATTSLIRDEGKVILVDPSLPAELLKQRLEERSGMAPDQVSVVFLTCFRPVHRRSLTLFEKAVWLMSEAEINAMRQHMQEMQLRTPSEDDEMHHLIQEEMSLLSRCRAADDKLTERIHLFPTPGVTPGAAGLLIAEPTSTVVIAGDAVLSKDYFEAGRVFEQAADVKLAQESLTEIAEIADMIVPGHDNVFRVFSR